MAVTFNSAEAQMTLSDRKIMIIGDSNMRALYKDIVWLLNLDSFVDYTTLRTKLEKSFMGDELLKKTALTKGRDFKEDRLYRRNRQHVEFHFVTKCFCPLIESLMGAIREKRQDEPDVIIMNSTLWDLSRWGPDGVHQYKENLLRLMSLLVTSLSPKCLFIWVTALPLDSKIRGGLLVKQIEFLEQSLRFHLMEANLYAAQVVSAVGFDVIDFHYHVHLQVARRCVDGVHMMPLPLRLLTNLTLTHLAITFDLTLPYHGDMILFNEELDLVKRCSNQEPKQLLNSYIDMNIRSDEEQLVIREKLNLVSRPQLPLPGTEGGNNLDESGVFALHREEEVGGHRTVELIEKVHEEQGLCERGSLLPSHDAGSAQTDTGALALISAEKRLVNSVAEPTHVSTVHAGRSSMDSGFGDDDHSVQIAPAVNRKVDSTKPSATGEPLLFSVGNFSSQTVPDRRSPRGPAKANGKNARRFTSKRKRKANNRASNPRNYYNRSASGYEFMLNNANYKFTAGHAPYECVLFNAPFQNSQLESRYVYWYNRPSSSYFQNDYY